MKLPPWIQLLAPLTCALSTAILMPITAAAQAVTLIIPSLPGGAIDGVARALGEAASSQPGRSVSVLNVDGARGINGLNRLASAPRDGTTVALLTANMVRALQSEGVSLPPMDVIADVGAVPLAIVTPPTLGAPDLRSLPRGTRIAHSGVGTSSHACAQALRTRLSSLGDEIAMRGIAPVMSALQEGQPTVACLDANIVTAPAKRGQLRMLAVQAARRLADLPATPTFAELQLGDISMARNWYAIVAATGVPMSVRAELTRLFSSAIASAQPRLVQFGLDEMNITLASNVGGVEARLRELKSQYVPSASAAAAPSPHQAAAISGASPSASTDLDEIAKRCVDKASGAANDYRKATATQQDTVRRGYEMTIEASKRSLAVYDQDADCIAARGEARVRRNRDHARANLDWGRQALERDTSSGGRSSSHDCRANNPNIPVGTCQ